MPLIRKDLSYKLTPWSLSLSQCWCRRFTLTPGIRPYAPTMESEVRAAPWTTTASHTAKPIDGTTSNMLIPQLRGAAELEPLPDPVGVLKRGGIDAQIIEGIHGTIVPNTGIENTDK